VGYEFIWLAFSELQSCRQVGMDLGSIPWTSIVQYTEHYNIIGGEAEAFIHLISVLDNHYLSSIQEKQK